MGLLQNSVFKLVEEVFNASKSQGVMLLKLETRHDLIP